MVDLKPLIRLRRYALDEKRRILTRLYVEAERLHTMKASMLDQIEQERAHTDAANTVETIVLFMIYIKNMRRKIEVVNEDISKMETRIELAMDDMRDSFAELKTIEIAHARRLEEIAALNRRRESAMFDETAIEGYRRRASEV